MTSSKRKKIPAQPLRAVPSQPEKEAPSVSVVVASPSSGYASVSAQLSRAASVVVRRTDGEEFFGIVVDEEFDLQPLSDEDLEDYSDEFAKAREEAEEEAEGDLAARFTTVNGVPLVLPPEEALRVFTAVQRAVCALRSQLVKAQLAGDAGSGNITLSDYSVPLIRPVVLAGEPDGE